MDPIWICLKGFLTVL